MTEVELKEMYQRLVTDDDAAGYWSIKLPYELWKKEYLLFHPGLRLDDER